MTALASKPHPTALPGIRAHRAVNHRHQRVGEMHGAGDPGARRQNLGATVADVVGSSEGSMALRVWSIMTAAMAFKHKGRHDKWSGGGSASGFRPGLTKPDAGSNSRSTRTAGSAEYPAGDFGNRPPIATPIEARIDRRCVLDRCGIEEPIGKRSHSATKQCEHANSAVTGSSP